MTKDDPALKEFKSELHDLLEKHGAIIYVDAHECSDWHGVTGEHVCVCLYPGHDHILVDHGMEISAGDLKNDQE